MANSRQRRAWPTAGKEARVIAPEEVQEGGRKKQKLREHHQCKGRKLSQQTAEFKEAFSTFNKDGDSTTES